MTTHHGRQARILDDVRRERDAQDARFGVQDLPDGTHDVFRSLANQHRDNCDAAFKGGNGTYRHVFLEEVFEAVAETDPVRLRAELIQAIAVGVKWVEGIDRREGR
ncbi:hypothetical protein [Streptomyces sp. NPDC088554]|uniref:hypothetical protein n=1 Tax=Streptomyces sp. NPDC088554 TaxID=3365865 RepID=UPI00382ADAA0